MEVVDHDPHSWFLVKDGDALLLAARCGHGAVEYSVVIELNTPEREEYAARSHACLDQLACDIHDSAPGARGSTSPYRSRITAPQRANQVNEAIQAYASRMLSPEIVLPLERPYANFPGGRSDAKTVLLAGLSWPTEYWVELALRWVEQGAPVNADAAAALQAIPSKEFSQRVRHRAQAAVKSRNGQA